MRSATRLIRRAPSAKQEVVRQIFLRLVDIAGIGSDEAVWRPVRRRIPMANFSTSQEQEMLQTLIDQKLLVSSGGKDTDATVEVAHEAVFTSWARLKKWIEGGKQVFSHETVLPMAQPSGRTGKRVTRPSAQDELLSGSRLAQALEMRARGIQCRRRWFVRSGDTVPRRQRRSSRPAQPRGAGAPTTRTYPGEEPG